MKYRRIPTLIDAVAWSGKYTNGSEFPEWFNEALHAKDIGINQDDSLWIVGFLGVGRVHIGDVVIRGADGEISTCSKDVFDRDYEAATKTE